MSISGSDQPVSKRRKVGHASTREATNGHEPQHGNEIDELYISDNEKLTSTRPVQTGSANKDRRSTTTISSNGITKSSLMQLQIHDLLEDITPEYDQHLRKLNPILTKLVRTIRSIPEQPPLSLSEAEKTWRKQHDIAIPFTAYRPSADVKYKFEYKCPSRIDLRGGLVRRSCVKDGLDVEVAVQMPLETFQEKDYLNHRAFHKRAFYTACIVRGIRENLGTDFQCGYDLLNSNDLTPIIILRPVGEEAIKAVQKIRITVNVMFPHAIGSIEKLLPTSNCVRKAIDDRAEVDSRDLATPRYNSTMRELASLPAIDQLLDQAAKSCDSFVDACLLGQTWLQQRGYTSSLLQGGFGAAEWAYMSALLLKGGGHKGHPLFSERYSSVQLFKAMLQVLANRDLTNPLVVNSPELRLEKTQPPILYDGENGVNVLAKMSAWSYEYLKYQAQISLDSINAKKLTSVESSFIVKVAQANLCYDEVYMIDLALPGLSTSGQMEDRLSTFYNVLKRGLGDRVSVLDLGQRSETEWKLSSVGPRNKALEKVEIRLLLNADATARLIDHGPTAEEPEEAREFRQFWGDKSELRRFRDGSITETLVWSSERPVTWQIISYLSALHFEVSPGSLRCKTPDLQVEHLSSDALISASDAFKIIRSKYQELSSRLHEMEGLPLPIRSVSPAGQALRSASIGHPLDPTLSVPTDVLIQFDSSTRWPDHLQAIQQTKIAFLAKISDLIIEADPSVTTRIGVENMGASRSGYYNTSYLDIVTPTSVPGTSLTVFRLRIHHEGEMQLLQDSLKDKTLSNPIRDTITAAFLEHKRSFVACSSHTTSIQNLITLFQPLSTTVRLLKSWIAAHNLSNHVPGQAIEIIAAYVFLQPRPWSIPGSSTTAFLRCLHFLSRWDWTAEPLIVDLSASQDMANTQHTELETRFQAWRKLDPNMNTVAWFVGTNVDSTGTTWTQGAKPPRVIAGRVTALAKAAISVTKSRGIDMGEDDWKGLFISPTIDFDFVIHLKPSVVRGHKGRERKKNELKFKNLQIQQGLDVDSIGHDIVALYLADLEKAFATSILFFHGEGCQHIAGLWRPNVAGEKEWRVRLGYSTVPLTSKTDDGGEQVKENAEINKEGILAEIALLGEGMIEKISLGG